MKLRFCNDGLVFLRVRSSLNRITENLFDRVVGTLNSLGVCVYGRNWKGPHSDEG